MILVCLHCCFWCFVNTVLRNPNTSPERLLLSVFFSRFKGMRVSLSFQPLADHLEETNSNRRRFKVDLYEQAKSRPSRYLTLRLTMAAIGTFSSARTVPGSTCDRCTVSIKWQRSLVPFYGIIDEWLESMVLARLSFMTWPNVLRSWRDIEQSSLRVTRACYSGIWPKKKLGAADSIVPFVSYRTKGTIESHMNEDWSRILVQYKFIQVDSLRMDKR